MINLGKIKMNVVETAGNGVVNHETIFAFNQIKDRVYARYSGGQVVRGLLVGQMVGEHLRFNYAQEHEDGKMAGGQSTCRISRQKDGKLRLIENFDWEQGQGRNVFQELD